MAIGALGHTTALCMNPQLSWMDIALHLTIIFHGLFCVFGNQPWHALLLFTIQVHLYSCSRYYVHIIQKYNHVTRVNYRIVIIVSCAPEMAVLALFIASTQLRLCAWSISCIIGMCIAHGVQKPPQPLQADAQGGERHCTQVLHWGWLSIIRSA
jgi:hypothetical protein